MALRDLLRRGVAPAVVEAVEAQRAFERTHPVPYAADQRLRATRERFVLLTKRQPTVKEDEALRAALEG